MLFINNKLFDTMARKNTIVETNLRVFTNKAQQQQQRTNSKYPSSAKYFKTISSSPPATPLLKCDNDRLVSPVRLNGNRSPPSHNNSASKATNQGGGSSSSSPRTSPGLLAGYYAGCKFSEPPLPSALPLPPQHWTQLQSPQHPQQIRAYMMKNDHINKTINELPDIAHQLKVLLKVQA